MKICLITDSHFGVKNDSLVFQDYFKRFYDTVFFPELRRRNIKVVVHGGDLFDRRKYVNFHILSRTRREFLERLADYETHILIGNHDTYFRDTNDVNSVVELCSRIPNTFVYQEPEEVKFGNLKVLLVPWLNPTNMQEGLEIVAKSKAPVLIGHLEVEGFHMDHSQISEHGLDRNIFKKFKKVYSGHFHHPSQEGNIQYLGAPYEMTFADLEGDRGFHIFDTETLELEFIPNPYRMFYRFVYDDRDESTHSALLAQDFSQFTNKYVKVIAAYKTNPYLFEQYMDRIYNADPADVSIDEVYSLDVADEADEQFVEFGIDSTTVVMSDTLAILNKYVESIGMDIDHSKLKDVMRELYVEAVATGVNA